MSSSSRYARHRMNDDKRDRGDYRSHRSGSSGSRDYQKSRSDSRTRYERRKDRNDRKSEKKSRQTPPKIMYGSMRSDYISHSNHSSGSTNHHSSSTTSSSGHRKRRSSRERVKTEAELKRSKGDNNGLEQLVVQVAETEKRKKKSKEPRKEKKHRKQKENGVDTGQSNTEPTKPPDSLVITAPGAAELNSFKLIVKQRDQAVAVASPVAAIQTDEEHHTDNESEHEPPSTVPVPPVVVQQPERLSFEKLAAQALGGEGKFLEAYQPPATKRPSLVPTDNSHEDLDDELVDSYLDEIQESSDALSDQSEPEPMDMDDRMAMKYYDSYSRGDTQWCKEFRLHGPECRKCRQRGNCAFPCSNDPKYQCKLCGQWSHHEAYCPDRTELEYRKNWNIRCFYCSRTNHLGRNCPDHWRQFHRTTGSTYVPFDTTPSRKSPSCYNCAGPHWGHQCQQPRLPAHGPVIDPFVTKRITESQSEVFVNDSDKIRREKRGDPT